MTTETTPPDDELDDLRHFKTMASAELVALRPLALQSAIRSAGYEPTSSAGRVLFELAKTEPRLAASPEALKRKAGELGLSSNVAAQPTPSAPATSELTDPSRPPTHSRNVPGTVAHDKALIQRANRDTFRHAAERMLGSDATSEYEPSPLQLAAKRVAAKWNPSTTKPNPWRAQTTIKPPPTAAQQKENRDAFEDRQKTAKKELRAITREVAAKMTSR